MPSTAIVWLRRDLRVSDQPALRHAVDHHDHVVPVFVFAPDEEAPWAPGAASRWWLHHSLTALADKLQDILSKGVVRIGVPLDVPPFGSQNVNRVAEGFDVDMADMVAKALGVKLELTQITGANRLPFLLTGAAALGLFKLFDQAIQGKDIRSAMWSGVKTGAQAFAAGQIGQHVCVDSVQLRTGQSLQL